MVINGGTYQLKCEDIGRVNIESWYHCVGSSLRLSSLNTRLMDIDLFQALVASRPTNRNKKQNLPDYSWRYIAVPQISQYLVVL